MTQTKPKSMQRVRILPAKPADAILNDLFAERNDLADIVAVTVCIHGAISLYSSCNDILRSIGLLDILKSELRDSILCGECSALENKDDQ